MRLHRLKSFSALALIPLVLALAGPAAPSTSAPSKMTNGCNVSARGIPSCGAYMGGAYGANANVVPWERSLGKTLGVHRTYWGASNVGSAVKRAKADASRNRVPWMSFKAPYSWSAMASGKGDAWARNLATRMKAVRGPVWVAVHHEPEGDGDIQTWKRMQARLAPIMRAAAPNLGYSIILMGYHQFRGAAKYSLSRTWPNTKIDVAGFDIYEMYGTKGSTKWKTFTRTYFKPIQAWAKRTGVAWGLAETGYSHKAARKDSGWMSRVYRSMKSHNGVAFSYFNTNLHSITDWRLNLATKKAAFKRVNRVAAKMR
jgi:hypothetical protein